MSALMDKIYIMQEQVGNVKRDMEIPRTKKEYQRFKKTLQQICRMPLMGLLVDWTWLRKESLNMKIYQQNLPKLKSKEEKKNTEKEITESSRTVGQLQNV